MKLKYTYAASRVGEQEFAEYTKRLEPEIKRIAASSERGYDSEYASLWLPDDQEMYEQVQQVVAQKRACKPTLLVVIGIGGSNLGTKAVLTALRGVLYNEDDPEIRCYFADTVDTDYVYDIVLLVEQEWEKGNEVILNVVSKSGTTTETVANFQLFFHLLAKARSNFQEYVVVTTDYGSALWKFAQQQSLTCLKIPARVGGRYSVFSPVGQFPLALCGIDVKQLLAGARSVVEECTESVGPGSNSAAERAVILYAAYQAGLVIHNLFVFSVDLQEVGAWYRQLIGESLGKRDARDGSEIRVGITPTVSVGTTDLHSVAQLYLGGPYNIFTTFVGVEKTKSDLLVPCSATFEQFPLQLGGRSLNQIRKAIYEGVQRAYENDHRPFDCITLPEKSLYAVGQLLQIQMIEVMYLGYLFEVNPFDQPEVELYKREARKGLR